MTTFTAAISKIANDARVDAIDAGASAPTLVLYNSSNTVLVTFALDGTTAFGDSTTACPSVATATGLPISTTASATGAGANGIDYARVFDGNGTQCAEETNITATGGGGAITVSSLDTTSGQDIDLTAFTISQPCS